MKILTITTLFPFPPHDGTRIQTYQRVKKLSANNEVTLLSVVDREPPPDAIAEMERYCRCKIIRAPAAAPSNGAKSKLWNLLRSVANGVPYYELDAFSPEAGQWLRQEVAAQRFDVVEADALAGIYLRAPLPAFKSWVIHSIRETAGKRELDFAHNGRDKLRIYAYWTVEKRHLRKLYRAVDLCATLTEDNERDLRRLDPRIEASHCLSNGIDLEYFSFAPPVPRPDGVCFVGKMDYLPNVDAVLYFYRSIWPLVREVNPAARFFIVGSHPTAEVRKLGNDPSVEVTGYVDDVRPYLRKAGVAVVPLRMGDGILNKVLEALALGVPLVTRSVALQGLTAEPGRDLLVSDDDRGYAEAVVGLLRDAELRARLARNGRRYAEKHHQWGTIVERYESELSRRIAARAERNNHA